MEIRRRDLMKRGARLLGATVLGRTLRALDSPATFISSEESGAKTSGQIWYSREYLTAETNVERLESWITPTEDFFVRNNLLMPTVDLERWGLQISGEVNRPFELSFQELQQLRSENVTNTLECAGNGRAFFRPRTGGVPWR